MRRSRKLPTCSGADAVHIFAHRLRSLSRRAIQSQRSFGQGARPQATADPRRYRPHHARLCHDLRRRRSRPAQTICRATGHCADVRSRRTQASCQRRDPSAQCRLGPVPRRGRTTSTAQCHCTWWAARAVRRRSNRLFARRAARVFRSGPLVARRRTVFVQLRLLARAGACPRRPSAGSVHSYSAAAVRCAAAAASRMPTPAFVSLTRACRRETPGRTHHGKPALTLPME
jgi:hypothetical protein